MNQLGGAYINGKPLPKEVRHEIITLALQGFRPCDISRRLRITHGCISKLLSKYRKTGSIQPGGEGVGRPRVITPHIAQRIKQYTQQQPGLYSWEIRERLVQENVCSRENIPSLSSISRLLKNKSKSETAAKGNQQTSSTSYTIASILNLPSNGESSSSTSSSTSSSSLGSNEKRIDDHQKNTGLWRKNCSHDAMFFIHFLCVVVAILLVRERVPQGLYLTHTSALLKENGDFIKLLLKIVGLW